MKIYISADIEGITGVTHWDETDKKNTDYNEFKEQMTAEVNAACEGALKAGVKEIWIKDAHASARNLIASKLPTEVKLIRGWSAHPLSMVQELDETFNALLMIGYHSRAGSDQNPLVHTLTGKVTSIRINDRYASEFLVHGYAAAMLKVPLVFISGDEGICREAKTCIPPIHTVAVKQGVGDSTINIHPHLALEKIRNEVTKSLQGNLNACLMKLPNTFHVEIQYGNHIDAYRASFYPGVTLKESHLLTFECNDYFEVLRLFSFVF